MAVHQWTQINASKILATVLHLDLIKASVRSVASKDIQPRDVPHFKCFPFNHLPLHPHPPTIQLLLGSHKLTLLPTPHHQTRPGYLIVAPLIISWSSKKQKMWLVLLLRQNIAQLLLLLLNSAGFAICSLNFASIWSAPSCLLRQCRCNTIKFKSGLPFSNEAYGSWLSLPPWSSSIWCSSRGSCFICRPTCWSSNQTSTSFSIPKITSQDWPLSMWPILRGHISM